MSSIILTWNNKNLCDLEIVTKSDSTPMLFDGSYDAKAYAEKHYVNFEIVTFYE
jgi:hypothetical protein